MKKILFLLLSIFPSIIFGMSYQQQELCFKSRELELAETKLDQNNFIGILGISITDSYQAMEPHKYSPFDIRSIASEHTSDYASFDPRLQNDLPQNLQTSIYDSCPLASEVTNPSMIKNFLYKDSWISLFSSNPDMTKDQEIARYKTYISKLDGNSLGYEINSLIARLKDTSMFNRHDRYVLSRRLSFIAKYVKIDQGLRYLLYIHAANKLEYALDGVKELKKVIYSRDILMINGEKVQLDQRKRAEIMQSARRIMFARPDYKAERAKHPTNYYNKILFTSDILNNIDLEFADAPQAQSNLFSQSGSFTQMLTHMVDIHPGINQLAIKGLTELQLQDSKFALHLSVTLEHIKEMHAKGILAAGPNVKLEALKHGIKHYFKSLIPNNPLRRPKEFTLNTIKYVALGILHTYTGGTLIPLQMTAQMAQKINTIRSADMNNMSAEEFAEYIAEELADITYMVATNKLLQKAGIPEVINDVINSGSEAEVQLAGGGSVPASELEDTTSHSYSSNNSRSGGRTSSNQSRNTTPEWIDYDYKHAPPQNKPWKTVVESTTSGVAKYKHEVDIKSLEIMAWEQGKQVAGKTWKIFECKDIIGAKNGVETKYMVVKSSSNTIHGHPITPQEYSKYLKR